MFDVFAPLPADDPVNVAVRAKKKGRIIKQTPVRQALLFAPPLNIQKQEIDKTLKIIEECIIEEEKENANIIPEMRELVQVDVALLPIGGIFTMDIGEAVEAAIAINPKVVIPMHRFKADPRKLADKIEKNSDIRSAPLDIGETYRLGD